MSRTLQTPSGALPGSAVERVDIDPRFNGIDAMEKGIRRS